MSDKLLSDSCIKSACSVSDLARKVELSRARFYNLVNNNIFPYPVYDIKTRRPFYPQHLQEICLKIKRTHISLEGNPVLFYSARKNNSAKKQKLASNGSDKITKKHNIQYQELTETLKQMGLKNIDYTQVDSAVNELYPDELPEDEGEILRDLFRYFKQKL